MRIVSLVPSLTELLFSLQLDSEIVGVTRFCIHPRAAKKKTKIGGTKNVKIDRIISLQPDLVIANKEENTQEDVLALQAQGIQVWVSDIKSYTNALAAIQEVGKLTDRVPQACKLVHQIELAFTQLPRVPQTPVLYLIWHEPDMTIGRDTFIHDMIQKLGFHNIIQQLRYPVIDYATMIHPSPAFVFLSSEPYPFQEKHLAHFQEMFPKSQVVLVDGEMFSWYGSRMLYAPKYFSELIQQLR